LFESDGSMCDCRFSKQLGTPALLEEAPSQVQQQRSSVAALTQCTNAMYKFTAGLCLLFSSAKTRRDLGTCTFPLTLCIYCIFE
jgi:hypothetical protein